MAIRIINFNDGFTSATAPSSGTFPASSVTNTAAGDIVAADVQAAINELDTEKMKRITSTDNAVPKFDTTNGDVQDTGITIDDSNNLELPASIVFDHIATPSNPSAGTLKLYAKSDNKIYTLTPGGSEVELGAGSGAVWNVTSKTAAYTAVVNDFILGDTNTVGAFTVTLPTASGNSGQRIGIKKTSSDSNGLTIDGNGTETIDGNLSIILFNQNDVIYVTSDGTNWLIVDSRIRPSVQRFTTGSGTYTTPLGVKYIKVKMVGAGGGGGGSGTASGGTGTAGGNTTFGSSFLTANGGNGGTPSSGGTSGSGGSGTINSPAITVLNITGGYGQGGGYDASDAGVGLMGGMGAATPLGGAGAGPSYSVAGIAASANTGSGGSGASTSTGVANMYAGGGGGAGAYLEAIINNPSSSYAYAVGAGGGGGSAGTSGFAGGAGADGIVIVEEYY